jgi:uncharacterized membrane protein YbhN (UPF0104 family)
VSDGFRSAWPRQLLRLAVSAVLLTLVLRLALPRDGRNLMDTLASAWIAPLPEALGWFAAACVLFGASFVVVARRFLVLLRAVGLEARLAPIVRAYVIANFLTIVLPSAVFSDVYRIADARRDTGSGAEVLAMVALERVLGLAALGGLVLAAAPFVPPSETTQANLPLLLALSGGLVAVSLGALHPRTNALLRRALAPVARLSPRLGSAADRGLAALARIATRRAVMLHGLLLSVLALLIQVTAIALLARPLDTSVAWNWYAVICPLVMLVTLVPISIGGAGVREWLFVELFGAVGMRAEVALSLSLSVFAVVLAWGFFGLLLFASGRRHPSRSGPPEATA